MIQIRKETRENLKSLRIYERETYDEIIRRLISLVKRELSDEDIKNIEEGLKDLREGRVCTQDQVEKMFNIKR